MDALIIIDMVNAYRKDMNKELIENQLKLIHAFKEAKIPVIFALPKKAKTSNKVMLMLWGDEFKGDEKRIKGERLQDNISELQMIRPSKLIKKEEYSAFYKTDLEEYCKRKSIDTIYLCGIYSGVCVHYTGIDAAMRNILPILITDASSTKSKSVHKENCKRFKEIAGKITTTKIILQKLRDYPKKASNTSRSLS